jgi:hypothetical protein
VKSFESFNSESYEADIYNLPLTQRQELKDLLVEMPVKESLNENIFTDIKTSLTSFLRKKAIDWLINLSEKELDKHIDNLTVLDPEDFSNINKCQIIYLGGGIDKTTEESAKMWREEIEDFFGDEHIIKIPEINITAKTGKFNKSKYAKPIIVNPMRNELIRWDDPKFADMHRKWKAGELNSGDFDIEDWKHWAKGTGSAISAADRRLVHICDTNLVCLNKSAGAGTLGELELGTISSTNHFIWLSAGYQIKDISPWLIPGIKKIIRSTAELYLLLNKIKEINS